MHPRPRIIRAPDLVQRGVSRRRREFYLRDGSLRRLRRGAYLAAVDLPPGVDAAERELVLGTHAAAADLRPGTVISHVSALALHGLPIHALDTQRVTTTRHRPGSGTRRTSSSVRYSADLAGAVVEIDGIPTTSVARSIVDVARSGRFTGALCAADGALHLEMCTRSDLEREAEAARGKRGVEVARGVVAFADGRAESVLESVSRLTIHRLGLPMPEPQVELRLGSSRTVYPDLFWEEWKLVGECDGLGKYGIEDGVPNARNALAAEKERQIDIESDGYRVVRWMWPHANTPARLEHLIRWGMALQVQAGFGPRRRRRAG